MPCSKLYANMMQSWLKLIASGNPCSYRRPDGTDYPMEDCPIDNSNVELKRMQNQTEVFVRKDGTLFPVVWYVHHHCSVKQSFHTC